MIWDKHDAAWRSHLTSAIDHHYAHGHLAVPAATPLGAWLAEQRHLAANDELTPARAEALNTLDPNWCLPYGADWHRKYHLLRAHLEAGNDPSALTPDIRIAGVNITSWLTRQLTRWTTLDPGQRDLLSTLNLTPATSPLVPPRRTRRTFAQTVQLLELFLHREGRAPTAREMINVDGERVQIGPWLAKARTKKRGGQLPAEHDSLLGTLFEGDWANDTAQPVALA